jgi:hypothetical protein
MALVRTATRTRPGVGALMRQAALLATAAVAALTVAGSSAGAPERDMVIRMGRGIGKVELGMTLPRVRRALGRPHVSVIRRIDFRARGRYLELEWELPGRRAWEPEVWSVGFRSWRRGAPLRVVRVSTGTRAQRTPQGLGVGSRPRQIVRAYPNATCVSRADSMPYRHDWIVVEARGGMTAFNLRKWDTWQEHPRDREVVAVMVQRAWFSMGPGHRPCSPGWAQS